MPFYISQFLCTASEKIRLPNHQPRFLLYKTPEGISGAKWSTFKMWQGKPGWPGHTKFVLGKWDTVHNVCLGFLVFISVFSFITKSVMSACCSSNASEEHPSVKGAVYNSEEPWSIWTWQTWQSMKSYFLQVGITM